MATNHEVAEPPRLDPMAVIFLAASMCLSVGLGLVLLLSGYAGPIHDALPRIAVIGPVVTASGGGISILRIRRAGGQLLGIELAWAAIAVSVATESFVLFLIAVVKVVSTFGN